MTTKEQVAAMAYSTGERLKSSAVELFRGLESSLQNRENFEIALAKMFGSCTGDFKNPRNQGNGDDLPHRSSSLSYSEEGPPQRHGTLGASPLRREYSNSSSRRMKSGSKTSASRRNGNNRRGSTGSESVSSRSSSRESSKSPKDRPRRERRQARADYGEHIYAQLFMDDQKRAQQAVSSLRESAVARAPPAATPAPQATTKTTTAVAAAAAPVNSSPFPVSSPPRTEAKIAPLSSNELHIPRTPTFDDGISAISQHTLEAMEERFNRTRSTDSSLWSSLKESKTPPLPTPTRSSPNTVMPRVRSAQSKASRQSRTSHTTHTSDTSSFQNLWQQEEQRYWSNQVEQDSRKSRKSRNESVRLRCEIRMIV